MEENPKYTYSLFKELTSKNHKGMCITRTFPEKIIEKYGLKNTPMLWLSRAQNDNSVLPTNLAAILHSSKDFIRKNKNSVILLDGIEYLVVHNDFSKVLKLVHGLNEVAVINQGILLIPLNQVTLDADKVALLGRDLKVVD
jgi:archaellum biogenesis ATPase FlaH